MKDREDREEKREERPPKRFEKVIIDACGCTQLPCDGECRELHYDSCPVKYKYYMEPMWKTRRPTEDNPKPKRIISGYRKVEIFD